MRIFVWHGYLLGGTGSNIYARQLSREWSREGHEVVVFSQERHPERFDLAGAETVRPDVNGFLPVFVIDEYEGYEVKRVQDSTREELEAWVAANADAMRERLPADFVFVNHVLMGGPVGEAVGAPYVVKAHGSELEYSMRGNAELSAWGQEALTGAEATVVGSEHIRHVLADVCGQTEDVHEIPLGEDLGSRHADRAGGLAASNLRPVRFGLDDVEAQMATLRASLLEGYGRWRLALEDVENLWALAAWKSAEEEAPEQPPSLAA